MADTYTITGQHESMDFDGSGRKLVNVHEISYEVTNGPGAGSVGTVTVQQKDYNDRYVDKAIRAKISALHSIAVLGQEPVE